MQRYTITNHGEQHTMRSQFHSQIDTLAKAPLTDEIYGLDISALFLQFLADSIDTEINGRSIGCGWFQDKKNVELFLQRCTDTAEFFYPLESRESATLVLESPALLASVPETKREAFILNMVRKGDVAFRPWYQWAINAGTPKKTVANVILTLLRESEYPEPGSEHYSFMKDFAWSSGGLGFVSEEERLPDASNHKIYVSDPNMWSIMTDAQLMEAVRVCTFICPEMLFSSTRRDALYWKLEAYLVGVQRTSYERRNNRVDLSMLLKETCLKALSLEHILPMIFKDLPEDTQRELIEKHRGISHGVLIDTTLRLGDRPMFDRHFKQLQERNPTWTYHFAQERCAEHPGALSKHVLQCVKMWIAIIGYHVVTALIDEHGCAYAIADGVRYVAAEDGPAIRKSGSVIFNGNGTLVSENPRTIETQFWPV